LLNELYNLKTIRRMSVGLFQLKEKKERWV